MMRCDSSLLEDGITHPCRLEDGHDGPHKSSGRGWGSWAVVFPCDLAGCEGERFAQRTLRGGDLLGLCLTHYRAIA